MKQNINTHITATAGLQVDIMIIAFLQNLFYCPSTQRSYKLKIGEPPSGPSSRYKWGFQVKANLDTILQDRDIHISASHSILPSAILYLGLRS